MDKLCVLLTFALGMEGSNPGSHLQLPVIVKGTRCAVAATTPRSGRAFLRLRSELAPSAVLRASSGGN